MSRGEIIHTLDTHPWRSVTLADEHSWQLLHGLLQRRKARLVSLPMKTRLLLVLGMAFGVIHAREWKSADGSKTVEAAFVAVQGDKLALSIAGKNSLFPLTAFAADDQQFAKNAQAITESAAKLGPQSFEFAHPVEDGSGWICRLALKTDLKAGGPKLFTGEAFFLVTKDAFAHQKGQRIENQVLFGAGGRTYHPLAGDPAMVRAFALDAEHATQRWMDVMAASGGDTAKQAPNVLEPDVEIATRHGFGIVIGKGGLVAIDPEIVKKGFKTLAVHHDGKDYPATLFSPKDKEGADIKTPDVQLVTCAVPLEAARIGTKETPKVADSAILISYELNTSKQGFVSLARIDEALVNPSPNRAEIRHNISLPEDRIGGFLLSRKGDVFGVMLRSTAGRGTFSKSSSGDDPNAAKCVSTQALSSLLEKIKGQGELKGGATNSDTLANSKALLASSVLVVATFEINKPRKIAPPKVAAPAANMPPGSDPPPAGWSLSKSGVRHSSKCQYYNAQYPCQPTEGRPCKVCGG